MKTAKTSTVTKEDGHQTGKLKFSCDFITEKKLISFNILLCKKKILLPVSTNACYCIKAALIIWFQVHLPNVTCACFHMWTPHHRNPG